MANGRALIDPPPFTPLPYGLISAAIDRTGEAPAHWGAGVTWQSECPDSGRTYDPCLIETRDDVDPTVTETDPAPTQADKTPVDPFQLRGATPFAVYTRVDCSPVGFWERAQDVAERSLSRSESHQVEQAFATGELESDGGTIDGIFPHLQDDTALVDTTGAVLQTVAEPVTTSTVDIVEGLGRLEDALGDCYHGVGVIHVPAALATALSAHDLVQVRGGAITTLQGNRVSLGTGYPGDAPDGTSTDGVAWIYATGAVFFFRSGVTIQQRTDSFDRAKNTLEALVERRYVLGWDCCHLAIPVTLGGIAAGEFDTAALEPSV